jgi:hypothetical protein
MSIGTPVIVAEVFLWFVLRIFKEIVELYVG